MAGDRAPREKNVVEGVKTRLKHARAFFFKSQSGGYGGVAGLPDFVVCYLGLFLGIECKRPGGGSLTRKQKATLRDIAQAGGIAVVVDSPVQVDDLLKHLREWDAAGRLETSVWRVPRDLRTDDWSPVA